MITVSYKKHIPKYLQMKQEIIDRINSGIYQPNQKLKSRPALAREFNTTIATCSRAIDELLSERIIESKPGVGTFIAAPEPRRKTLSIHAVVKNFVNPYYSTFADTLGQVCKDHDFFPASSFSSNGSPDYESRIIHDLLSRPETVIFMYGFLSPETREMIRQDGNRFYIFGHAPELTNATNIMSTTTNGAQIAVKYLIDHGHQKIAYLGKTSTRFSNRYQSYLTVMKNCGLEVNPAWGYHIDFFENLTRREKDLALNDFVEKIMSAEDRPSAVFCYNDYIAINLLETCRKAGLNVPEELSICGYDGAIDFFRDDCRITTVCQPIKRLMTQAIKHILDAENNEFISLELPPEIVEGNTVISLN